MSGWIGVDLDGTLAVYDPDKTIAHIGPPVEAMLERVKGWLKRGITVKIVTARMSAHGIPDMRGGTVDMLSPIQEWCERHVGQILEVTNAKDFGMIELWDDRAIQVETNTGRLVAGVES